MRGIIICGALALATPVSAQTGTSNDPAPVAAAETRPLWLRGWTGAIELSASPAFGEPIRTGVDDDPVDDSEYEALVRFRRPLDRLGGIRLQLQAGVTSTPEFLEGSLDESRESSVYGEVQLGDTFVPFRELRRRNFRITANSTEPAALRPFVRYRFARVDEGTFDGYLRTDHTLTAGLRYRRIPFVTNDGKEPGLYYELRAQVTRIWSTDPGEEIWNPRVQADVYSQPCWRGTRFVFRTSAEVNFFDNVRVPDANGNPTDERRREPRFRVHLGFDVSKPLQTWLRFEDIELELMGRIQRRESNDESREHWRLYFVPSLTLTIPLKG
jgi:hypothetical protein